MYRSHNCWELNKNHVDHVVTLSGWVDNIRKMGAMSFLTLRDRYGVTQLSDLEGKLTGFLQDIKYEDCIQITGTVIARPTGQENNAMATGEIEVALETITILGKSKELPFSIVDEPNTSEELRFKHRYIDIRRKKVLDNIKFRAQMNQFTRNRFSDHEFLEVQTPLFTVSSPEGARDFLIPSRVNPGKFYALPQAPQQYKQLLMIGGVDKYFQIAPCFRDEDPRADRHSCEFYQIDVEMSFVHQEDVHGVAQAYISDLIPSVSDKRIIDPLERLPFLREYIPHPNPLPTATLGEGAGTTMFPKIPYDIAMNLFGSDKPDLRFDCHLVDVTEFFRTSEASFIAEPLSQGSSFKAMRLAGHISTRKEIDAITEVAKQAGAGWLPYISLDSEGLKGSIAKFITPEVLENLKTTTEFAEGDTLFFFLGNAASIAKAGNKVRMDLRERFLLVDSKELAFAWIVNFPFFEVEDDKVDFCHNPFSMVTGWAETLRQVMEEGLDPTSVVSEQYDMVCNGYEILSGSIRNNSVEVLVKAFEFVGKSEADVKQKFWAMYEAFQYGCPPHGWFAFGFDRLLMILKDEPNIREVYAFPKSGRAEDVMMGAPSEVEEMQLKELSISTIGLDL
jgi:aspartyl-tRNA synthetase